MEKKKSWIGLKVQSSITSEERIFVKGFLIIHVPMIVLPNQKQEGKSLFPPRCLKFSTNLWKQAEGIILSLAKAV